MRLGIFGGSFDPVHLGHLLLAECCREQRRLDEVWFMPAALPPHKLKATLAADSARVEMLRLAIGGDTSYSISTLEIDRGGVSYTVDTLASLRRQRPDDRLFLLLGADSLADLPTWREPGRICELATPIVVARAGAMAPDFGMLAPFISPERLVEIQGHQVEMPAVDLRASEIRRRVGAGLSIRFRTPRAVEMYIATGGLYRVAGAR